MYNFAMKKSLLTTNPYLKDTVQRERFLTRNIESSSAVERIFVKRDAASGRFIATKTISSSTQAVKKKTSR